MTRSAKLGIASVLLLVAIFIPPFADWRGPLSFATSWISFVLGLLAAQQGSKWWLVVPGAITTGFGIVIYAAFHSY
jgi:hypothetical protein